MNYHKSLNTLPIANFNAIRETNNLGYMFGGDYLACENQKALPEMLPIWVKMQDEYSEIVSKRQLSTVILDLEYEIGELMTQRLMIDVYCNQILLGQNTELYLNELDNTDYPINRTGDIKEQAKMILHRIENLISKANENRAEIERLSKTGKGSTFEEMLSAIEDHTKKSINPFTITVKQWLTEEDKFITAINKRKKNGNR